MAVKINVGTVWKESTPWVNVNGEWKQCSQVWVNVGGTTWKQLIIGTVSMPASTSAYSEDWGPPKTTAAWFTLGSGGGWVAYGNTSQNNGDWLSPQAGMSAYDCRATWVSGVTPGGPAFGSWHNCGASRTWTLSITTGSASAVFNVAISLAGQGTPIDTMQVTLSAEVHEGQPP